MKTPMNVAIVDDEEEFHSIVKLNFRHELREDRVKLFNFLNGKEFLNFLEKEGEHIEIIILVSDINMPEMDGFTLCEIIRRDYPGIDIFMASAYDKEDYKERAKDIGVEDFLIKPVDFNKLKEIINKKLEE